MRSSGSRNDESSYVAKKGEQILSNKIKAEQIFEDQDGNCIVNGKRIEANACSMIKDNYRI